MKYRLLGKTGFEVSEISLGTWQLGGKWGEQFSEKTASDILEKAIDNGINFIDTADIYNDGMSEKAIGRVIKKRKEKIYVATKCGRKSDPHVADAYNENNIRKYIEGSLKNMNLETLDLIQLHCPPYEVYYNPYVFETLEKLKDEGKILNYGVSVERVEEALKVIDYAGVSTVQIIFNMFRLRPSEHFFPEAKKKNIGIIVRIPLASGLLTGKFNPDTIFGKNDHRYFNREGKFFSKGETFSGVDYDKGLQAVSELKEIFNGPHELAQIALRWILMFDEVSCVIPGASSVKQIESNIKASELSKLSIEQMDEVKKIYEKYIKKPVHYLW